MAKELDLGIEQISISAARTPDSPLIRSVEAPEGEIQSQKCNEITGSRPEEPRDASRCGTPASGLEEQRERGEWQQWDTRVKETSEGASHELKCW